MKIFLSTLACILALSILNGQTSKIGEVANVIEFSDYDIAIVEIDNGEIHSYHRLIKSGTTIERTLLLNPCD